MKKEIIESPDEPLNSELVELLTKVEGYKLPKNKPIIVKYGKKWIYEKGEQR